MDVSCPNNSIIVISYSTHVICTIWQLLEVFSCFYKWNHSHIPYTLLYSSITSHTLKHMSHSLIYVLEHSHLFIYNSNTYQLLTYHSHTSQTLNYLSYESKDQSHVTRTSFTYINITQLYLYDECLSELFSETENICFWMNQNRILQRLNQKSTV